MTSSADVIRRFFTPYAALKALLSSRRLAGTTIRIRRLSAWQTRALAPSSSGVPRTPGRLFTGEHGLVLQHPVLHATGREQVQNPPHQR